MEGWRSKIDIPYEWGPYSDVTKLNIFQICGGKFLTIFREKFDKGSPCPSTWHKYDKYWEKILINDPFSALLHKMAFLESDADWIEVSLFYKRMNYIVIKRVQNKYDFHKKMHYLCCKSIFIMNDNQKRHLYTIVSKTHILKKDF